MGARGRLYPELRKALDAGPVVGMTHLITNSRGQPFKWGLTDFIERAVELTGLPPARRAHGLRKAGLRRLPPRRAARSTR